MFDTLAEKNQDKQIIEDLSNQMDKLKSAEKWNSVVSMHKTQ